MIQQTDRDWARRNSRLISTSTFQLQLLPAWCDMITLKKYLTRAGGKRSAATPATPVAYYMTGFSHDPYHLQQMVHIFTPIPDAFSSSICGELISGAVTGLFCFVFKCRHDLFPLLISLSSYENWQTEGLETGAVAGKHISFPAPCFENNLTQCYEKMWTTTTEKLALHEWLSRFEDM